MPVPTLFAAAIFLGAFLLFLVQPIMGRFILPWFGGGASVWTACMLFFQIALLAGYAYAHLLTSVASAKRQAIVHLALLAGSLAFLPIAPDLAWKPEPGEASAGRVLLLLSATIGPPFVLLSATAPLIQKWFAHVFPDRSPYRLYALSNAGSVAALAVYPFLVEPLMTRQSQSSGWSGGMILFAVVCGGCAAVILKATQPSEHLPASADAPTTSAKTDDPGAPAARWLALSACGSVLLLATTSEMSRDVAVMPYLWVAPLAIYLATFIICFDRPERYSHKIYGHAFLLALVAVCFGFYFRNSLGFYARVSIQSVALFLGCMVCHGKLANLKPAPTRLTAYYLSISTGGALGGALVSLAAPMLFCGYHEYALGLLGCAVLCIGRPGRKLQGDQPDSSPWLDRSWKWAAIAGCAAFFLFDVWSANKTALSSSRNFFGAISVHELKTDDSERNARYLKHDNIVHGFQLQAPGKQDTPTGYYGPSGGGGLILNEFRVDRPRRIGIVGLGVGTLATYGRPDDVFRIYEIDPAVIEAARTSFTFLQDSKAAIETIEGDARLVMEQEPEQAFDVLILDAFTSDAVPVHLLTIEAMQTWRRHLARDGVLAFHLSSQHLQLSSVVGAAAEELGMARLRIRDRPRPDLWERYTSEWMLVSDDAILLDRIGAAHPSTRRGGSDKKIKPWTDDHASLMSVLN